jgi:hypothetical protein
MKINSIAAPSLVVLSLLLTAAGAYAQCGVETHVPFAFKVGTAQMPSGNYTVKREAGSAIITVRNVKTGITVQAPVRPESPSKQTEKLIFHHYGRQYILAEVWGTAGSEGMALSPTMPKRNLELAHGPANAGTNVETARK